MICEFMCRKFDFSTQGSAILFAHTFILILFNWVLEFFESSLNPSPFLLITTPLPFQAIFYIMNLNLLTFDHICETFNPHLVKIFSFVILWALSPTLEVDVFINI